MNDLTLNKKPRKIRSLSKEHKQKISSALNGKKKVASYTPRKKTNLIPIWISKPVICINNNKRYDSLSDASKEIYKTKRCYHYISQVCKGVKPHYKKLLWLYETDYVLLSESEKEALKLKCLELKKPTVKYRTKLLYKNNIYDSACDLGLILFNDGLLSYRNNTHEDLSKLLSTMISFAKKKHCPFIMLKEYYIFWADYKIFFKDSQGVTKLSEEPVTNDLKELYECYIKCLDHVIGDLSIGELLNSSKGTFYKLDNMYYKNECNIKKYTHDNIIDKSTLLSLINNDTYKLLFDKDDFDLDNTTKSKFYIKNNYIFLNKNDYINRFIKLLTKEEIIKELNIMG